MIGEEIALREESNRIMAWLKSPPARIVATPQQRTLNQRTFSLLRALRQRQRCTAGEGRSA
ncbi:MAG: hypothetical protein ACJ8FY_19680 [Gemmataceae bacterium]